MIKDKKKIEEVLTKGVEQILPSKEELLELMQKRKIRLYWGVDPTSPFLHLGHYSILRKLKEFQDLGHEVIFLIGDFTAKIGDPSGREEARKPLSEREIRENLKTYKKQIGKVLDLKKTKILRNSKWLSKMKLDEFLKIASFFTVQQNIQREMFQKRIEKGISIWLHEFLYPLLQAFDSVAMDVDLEIGASDQLFNMLCGRELMKILRGKEKFVLTMPLLPGLDGRKMSKTYQNTVNILDKPKEMFGKLMSMKDELILPYVRLLTDLNEEEIKKIKNPRDQKEVLAKEIVSKFYGEKVAKECAEEFKRVFREKKLPKRIPKIKIKGKVLNIVDLLIKSGFALSKSEAKRLIVQGGVKVDGKVIKDWREKIEIKKETIIQVGKRKFKKIIPSD